MKLLSVSLHHFRVFADAHIDFPATGIVGLIGANGHGKSSVLESIQFALWGVEATRGSKASLRWNRAPARRKAEVELVFEVGGTTYVIRRSETDAELRIRNGRIIAAGTSAVNGAVPGIVGMSAAEWARTHMAEQKQLAAIATMKPVERRAFIASVMGLSRIDEALEACRSRKNDLSRELAGLSAGLGEREPLLAEVSAAEDALFAATEAVDAAHVELALARDIAETADQALVESDARRRRHDELVQIQASAAQEAEAAEAAIEKLAAELDAAHAARARLAEQEPKLAELVPLRAEREKLAVAKANAETRRAVREQLEGSAKLVHDIRTKLVEVDATIALHDEAAWKRVGDAYREAESRLRALREARIARRHRKLAEVQRAKEDLAEIDERIRTIRSAGAAGACPTCARALAEQFEAVLLTLEEQALDVRDRAEDAQTEADLLVSPEDDEVEAEVRLDDLKTEGERLRAIRDNAQRCQRDRQAYVGTMEHHERETEALEARLAELPGAQVDEARLSYVTSLINALERLDRELAKDREAAGRIQVLQQQRLDWEDRHRAACDRRITAEADIAVLHFYPEEYGKLKDEAAAATKAREDASAALARAQQAVAGGEERLKRAEQAIEAYDTRARQLTELQEQVRTHTAAADRLNAFRIAAAAQIRPELEELTSGFVSLLTDGRHEAVQIDDSFAVTLLESGVPIEVASGGTEDVAALALRLAVSQAIAERAGHPLSLLILDEPFGSLDAVRRGNVLSLIRRLSGIFSQVLLISHVDETRESVDYVVHVDFDEAAGCSRVTQSYTAPEASAPAEEAAA